MSWNDTSVLRVYQGDRARWAATSRGRVAVPGVPQDDQGVGGQAERDGAFDGAGGAVAGLADAEDLAHLAEDDLDGPAGGVPVMICSTGVVRSVVISARS